ncbi:MAG: zinc finger domain-containing protein [Thermoplasmata archaeon]|nr:zinc finger domain-containing protein [Thermoplasmata archaeon]
MAVSDRRCSSCGMALAGKGAAHFPCPDCGEAILGRCARCRDQSVAYTCPKCGFVGP